jgi:FlaG/FlaF family flagellin (archaellin)
MRKSCLLAATLLLSVWVFAQTAPSAGQQSNPVQAGSQESGADRGGNAIEGCIAGSPGSFTLTDSSGKTYQLAGDTAKLNDHVGHTLLISGSQKSGGADPQGGSSAQPTFIVQKVKMVSSSCSASK